MACADRPAPRQYSAPAPAAPQYGQKVPQILSQQFDLRDDQSYDASFETENGISASESGKPVAGYGDESSYEVQGQYSYTGDDGVTYTVTYVADANGFQPQAAHLPTPVPTEYPTPEVPATQASYQAAPAPQPRYQAAPAPAPEPRYQPAPAPTQPQYQQYQPRYQ